jgi:hypothetical protein
MFKGLDQKYKDEIVRLGDRAWAMGLGGVRFETWVMYHVAWAAFVSWKGGHRECLRLVKGELLRHERSYGLFVRDSYRRKIRELEEDCQ